MSQKGGPRCAYAPILAFCRGLVLPGRLLLRPNQGSAAEHAIVYLEHEKASF